MTLIIWKCEVVEAIYVGGRFPSEYVALKHEAQKVCSYSDVWAMFYRFSPRVPIDKICSHLPSFAHQTIAYRYYKSSIIELPSVPLPESCNHKDCKSTLKRFTRFTALFTSKACFRPQLRPKTNASAVCPAFSACSCKDTARTLVKMSAWRGGWFFGLSRPLERFK